MGICLKYYNVIEWFSGFNEEIFKLSNDKMTITRTRGNIKVCQEPDHTIFGNFWIPSTSKSISKWTIAIHEMSSFEIIFGFASQYDINSDFSKDDEESIPNYAASSKAILYTNGEAEYIYWNSDPPVGEDLLTFYDQCVVTITLDLIAAQIRMDNDIRSEIVLFDKITIDEHIRYIFAMQMLSEEDSVT